VEPPGLPTAAKRAALQYTGFFRQGWPAMKRYADKLIQALVFIRLGQQLGTDSELAQAVAHGIDLIVSMLSRFCS
jgi:hypothetical protein